MLNSTADLQDTTSCWCSLSCCHGNAAHLAGRGCKSSTLAGEQQIGVVGSTVPARQGEAAPLAVGSLLSHNLLHRDYDANAA
jgi:hypothetical protein